MKNTDYNLFFIGMGLNGLNSCSIEALKILEIVDEILIENYTNFSPAEIPEQISKFTNIITFVTREDLEENDHTLIEKAKSKKIALLVSGDPFVATTHISLRTLAEEEGIKSLIIHNTSILSAAASVSGLSGYKFGRTITIPFRKNYSKYPYDIIRLNKSIDSHTLALLDIDIPNQQFLSVSEAIEILLSLEKEQNLQIITDKSILIGLCKIGQQGNKMIIGNPNEVKNHSWKEWGSPQALIICSDNLSVVEEEALNTFKE